MKKHKNFSPFSNRERRTHTQHPLKKDLSTDITGFILTEPQMASIQKSDNQNSCSAHQLIMKTKFFSALS